MRAFLAFSLPPEVKEKIIRIISSFSFLPAKIKWVEKNNLHLTIRFFLDIKKTAIELIEKKLKIRLLQTPKIKVKAKEICLLKHKKDFRLIYLELEDNLFLSKTIEEIKSLTSAIIPNPEKRKPLLHITLGRIKYVYNKEKLEKSIKNYKFFPWEWHMEEVVLFESILKPQGPLYQPLFKIELAEKLSH